MDLNAAQIENIICEAVDIIASEKLSNLEFDRTIQARIITCVDSSIGKYKIKYQDSIMYAYAENINTTYLDNQEVYVVIPSNDFSGTKVIRGSVRKLGTNYISSVTPEDKFTKVGTDIIDDSAAFGLVSYQPGTTEIILYSANQPEENNLISIDKEDLNFYKAGMKQVSIAAKFKTALDAKQQFSGDYGIRFSIDYWDNTGTERQRVTRHYILDVDKMTGNPYKFIVPSRQYGIFDIDGDNLIEINAITIFSKDFPYTNAEITKEDIFISDIEFQFMEPLSDSELSASSLKLITPLGTYYKKDETFKKLEAELKFQGLKIDYSSQKVDFYWFIEDIGVTSSDPYYFKYGGQGWRCLNDSQVIAEATEDSEATIYFKPGSYKYNVNISQCQSYTTRFKCVAIYGDSVLNTVITLYNMNSAYKVELLSTAGNQFYFDIGITDLICQVYKGNPLTDEWYIQEAGDFSYSWGYYNEAGTYIAIDNDSNMYKDFEINGITNMATFKCTVSKDGNVFGTGTVVLYNSMTTEGVYNLVINNGTKVFKYNENGISPASPTMEDPIDIEVLTFDIYDNLGNPLEEDIKKYCKIKWTIPTQLTMLTHDYEGRLVDNGDGTSSLEDSTSFVYGIASKYNINNNYNNISLQVTYQDLILVQSTDFTFTKEGELGTNGTQYTCRIIPYYPQYKNVYIEYKGKLTGYFNTNSTSNANVRPFKVQLWADEVLVYESNNAEFDNAGKVKWTLQDDNSRSSISIRDAATGIFAVNNWNEDNTANIVKAEVTYQKQTFYATYPVRVYYRPESFMCEVVNGYSYCTYESDGTRYKYNQARPFEFKIYDVEGEDISGLIKDITWEASKNFKLKDLTDAEKNVIINKKNVIPPDNYDGLITNNYVKVKATYNGSKFFAIVPIHLFLNRFGLSFLNGWDGNSIEINNDDNYILTPQIGAGVKDSNNRFTGVVMGKVQEVTQTKADIGLVGYSRGQRSIFLDADTGNATFGVSGEGQIKLVPGGTSSIAGWEINVNSLSKQSGNNRVTLNASASETARAFEATNGSRRTYIQYNGHFYSDTGKIGGWNINTDSLTAGKVTLNANGSISTGNFQVDTNGAITSTSGKIGGWTIGSNTLTGGGIELNSNGSIKGANGYFTVDTGGNMTATTGKIGGWTISNGLLSNGNVTLGAGGSGNGTLSCGNNWQIKNDGSAMFTNATITGGNFTIGSNFAVTNTGALTALSGNIAGWGINASSLSKGNMSISSSSGLKFGNNFSVDQNGNLKCNSATLSGTVSASGVIFKNGSGGEIKMNGDRNHPYVSGLNVGSGGMDMGGSGITGIGDLTGSGTFTANKGDFKNIIVSGDIAHTQNGSYVTAHGNIIGGINSEISGLKSDISDLKSRVSALEKNK